MIYIIFLIYSDTARLVPYYEQHFLVSTVSAGLFKEDKEIKVLTRITDRTMLLWIQEKTGKLQLANVFL